MSREKSLSDVMCRYCERIADSVEELASHVKYTHAGQGTPDKGGELDAILCITSEHVKLGTVYQCGVCGEGWGTQDFDYSEAKAAIEALIAQAEASLLERLAAGLPEKKHTSQVRDSETTYEYIGYNAALSAVRELLEAERGKL